MKIQDPVKQETKKIAIGVTVLSVVMILVFAALGRFDIGVVYGTLLGGGFAILNFFAMAMTVQEAAEQMNGVVLPPEEDDAQTQSTEPTAPKEELPQQKKARSMIQRSYYIRILATAVMAIVAVKVPAFNAVAAVVAQFFPRVVITVQPVLQKFQKGE